MDYSELVKKLRNRRVCIQSGGDLERDFPVMREAADAIEELLRKEKFHAFLWNVINPNDMRLLLEMYHSGEEEQEARE